MTDTEKPNLYRKNAIIVGVLFIIATVFLFIGEAIYAPALNTPNYLETAYPGRIMATLGMLIEFVCVLAIPLIPVFLFPVLRKHSETLALGYVIFRFFEAVLFVLVEINTLMLISVSQQYLANGSGNASFFQNLGDSILSWNVWAFSFYVLIFAIGAMILYTALYQSKLVPRFISAWGLLAAIMILAGSVLSLLEVDFGLSSSVFQLITAMPIAVQEMVMALWLIIKGFNPSALTPTST